MYQTRSISMRASVPTICAAFKPAPRDDDTVVEIAPPACTKVVATSASLPASERRARAVMRSGSPSTSTAKEIG